MRFTKGIKVLCIITAFILLFSVVPAGAARIFYDIPESDPLYSVVQELNALKIIIGNPNVEYNPEASITRGEYALILERYLGLQDSQNLVTGFADVPSTHDSYHAIGALVGAGYMQPIDATRFEPEWNMGLEDAASILLNIMGYGPIAERKGYITTASDVGLLKGIAMGTTFVSRRNIAMLIYNSLDAETMETTGISLDGSVTLQKAAPILERFRDILYTNGIIEANEITSLFTDAGCTEGYINLNNILYEVSDSKADRLLGYRVKLYYQVDIRAGTKVAVAAIAREDKNKVTTVFDKDIVSLSDDYDCEYYDVGDKKKTQNTDNTIFATIYNGVQRTDFKYDKNDFKGYFEFIDNNNDGDTDVVCIWEYINVRVSSVDLENNEIYGRYYNAPNPQPSTAPNPGSTKCYTYTSANFILESSGVGYHDVYKNQAEAAFTDIKPDQTISLFRSKPVDGDSDNGSKYSKIYISDVVVKGNIDEISDDEIIVSGEKLEIDPAFAGDVSNRINAISIGATRTLFIDAFGKIADVDLENAQAAPGINYGLIIKLAQGSGIEPKLGFKIFGQDAKMHILNVAERVELNGVWTDIKKSTATGLNQIEDIIKTTDLPYIVRYRINADGEINFLDTPSADISAQESSDPFALKTSVTFPKLTFAANESVGAGNSAYCRNNVLYPNYSNLDSVKNTTFLDSKTVVFYRPYRLNCDDSDYAILGAGKILNYASYYINTYNTDEFGIPKVAYLVDYNQRDYTTVGFSTFSTAQFGFRRETVNYGQIAAVKQGIGSDGESTVKLTINTGGAPKDYVCSSDVGKYLLSRNSLIASGGTAPAPQPLVAQDVSTLSIGDVVRFRTNNKGEIYGIYPDIKIMKIGTVENAVLTSDIYMYNGTGDGAFAVNYADFCYGFVYSKDAVSSRISVASSTSAADTGAFGDKSDCTVFGDLETAAKRPVATTAGTKVSIYKAVSKKVVKGSMADVRDYKNQGKPSLVFIKINDSNVTELFIFDFDR